MKNFEKLLLLFIASFLFANNIVETENQHYVKYDQVSPLEINVEINTGEGSFIAYTCDFTKDYIDINADYRS